MDEHEQIRELIPAHSLGCLDPAEAAIIAEHLEKCPPCREEYDRNFELVGMLALAVPQKTPSPDLKERILSAARASPIAKAETNRPFPEVPSKPGNKRGNFFQLALPAWGVLSLILVAMLSIGNLRLAQRINALEQAQPGFQTIKLKGTDLSPAAQGLLVISPDGQNGSLVVDQMPPLSENQDYQLWLIKDNLRTNGGVFHSYSDGYGVLWIHTTEPLISYDEVGVTVEPLGGSLAPTGDRILAGRLR